MKIAVKGVGITKFGELWDKSLFDLGLDAAEQAIKDSGIKKDQIETVFVANMIDTKVSNKDHLGAAIASKLGLTGVSAKIEAACASGGVATHLAVLALLSGLYQNVLVVGVEKMTDALSSQITTALMGAASESERTAGLTFPGLYALMAQAHIQKYGTTRSQLASTAIKNHYHASLNQNAQFPFEITLEQVLNGTPIADPLTLFDASPVTDGAAAVVLSSQTTPHGVYICASAVSTDSLDLAGRTSLTEISATKAAVQKALGQAGLQISDVNLAEVHDCFTIAEVLAMEDLGFCSKGEGGRFIESGITRLGGKLPVNTSGGLKACGHPIGATGVKQIVEVTQQLRGVLGPRQVEKATVGLTQNVGGTGATVAIHLLQK